MTSTANPWGVRRPNLITENKFLNAARPSLTVLVEAGSDKRFWRMFLPWRLEDMGQGGREAALKTLEKARSQRDTRFLAILDADVDRLKGRPLEGEDILYTDGHDLETTLFGLPVLEKITRYHVDTELLGKTRRAGASRFVNDCFGMQ